MPESPPTFVSRLGTLAGCGTLSAIAVLLFFLVFSSISFGWMTWTGHPELSWTRLLLGPVFVGLLLTLFPGNTRQRLRDRLVFTLLAIGAGSAMYTAVIHAGRTISFAGDDMLRLTAGPREEGIKLLGALLLVSACSWARGWPNRLVILGMAAGLSFGGFENIQYLGRIDGGVLFHRSMALVVHTTLAGFALSGVVLARYLRSPARWLLPPTTYGIAVAVHMAHLYAIKPIHAWFLVRVDDLPQVMTSEQWFGAPHYNELMFLVNGGSNVPAIAALVAMMLLIRRLARTREARP